MDQFYTYVYLDPRKKGHYCYNNVCFLYEPIYIGKGRGKRYLKHLVDLNKHKYINGYFKNKLQKILKDESNIENYILIFRDRLLEYEAFNLEMQLIKEIGRHNLKSGPLTNLTDGGEGMSGIIFSEKTKQKISKSLIGRKASKETKQKISKALTGKMAGENNPMFGKQPRLGKHHLTETKQKISLANKGKKLSEETKIKIGKAGCGRKHSEETKRKLSLLNLGENNPMFGKPGVRLGKRHTEETKRKLSESHKGQISPNKGKVFSEEYRKKLSEAHKGIKLSEEAKRKLSEFNTGRKHSLKSRKKMCEKQRGENNPSAKLSERQVHQIHMLLKLGFKNSEISKKYDMAIGDVKRGRSWKSIFNIFNKQP